MPLIDVTLRPGYVFPEFTGREEPAIEARRFVRKAFGGRLPGRFVHNRAAFGMDDKTPEDGVQVQFHDYDEDDINVADVWVKVQFSEDLPEMPRRIEIRDAVFDCLVKTFDGLAVSVPDNFILDVFWGPTNGCGRVNGTSIEWVINYSILLHPHERRCHQQWEPLE